MEIKDKTLLGSFVNMLQKKRILGKEVKTKPIILYNLLLTNYRFAEAEHRKGKKEFKEKVETIERLMNELVYQCEDICLYTKIKCMETWSIEVGDIPETQIKSEQTTPHIIQLKAITDLPENQIKSTIWTEISNPGKSLEFKQINKLTAELRTNNDPSTYYGEYKYRCEITNICDVKRQKTFTFVIKRIRKGECFAGLKFYVLYTNTKNVVLKTTNKYTVLNGVEIVGTTGHNCNRATFKIVANSIEVGKAYLNNNGDSNDKKNTLSSVGITKADGTAFDNSTRISEIILTPELAEEINKKAKATGNNTLYLSFLCDAGKNQCHSPIGTIIVVKDDKIIKDPNTNKPYFNPDGNFLNLEICKSDIIE